MTGDVGKGPSETTGYYQAVDVPSSGYTIYLYNENSSNNLSYHVANNDEELISFTNGISNQSFTSTTQCFNYYRQEPNLVLFNNNIEPIVTDGLILYLDPSKRESYPLSGTTWYNLSTNNQNTTLINGTQYSGNSGGTLKFDGVDDYVTIPNQVSASTEVTMLFWINKVFTNYYFHMNSRNTNDRSGPQTGVGSTTPITSNGWCQVGYLWNGNTNYFIFNGSVITANTGGKFAYDNSSAIVPFSSNNNGYFAGNNAPVTNFSLQNSSGGNSGYQWLNRNNKVLGILSTSGNRRPFNGEMGNVLFYDRALTSDEITQNYEVIGKRYVSLEVESLVVAGGGGGDNFKGGGGGAGGLLTGTDSALNMNTPYSVLIGGGGSAQSNGSNSMFNNITTLGGGSGSNSGGSGGGANGAHGGGGYGRLGGAGTPGQGNDGGATFDGITPTNNSGGGGGGGAGAVGNYAIETAGGDGGEGIYIAEYSSLGGYPAGWFAGGAGGGAPYNDNRGLGSNGGGGRGARNRRDVPNAEEGVINTGGGGGGGSSGGYASGYYFAVAGGSGIVILRIPDVYNANFSSGVSWSLTKTNGYKYYKVTATSTTSETVSFS